MNTLELNQQSVAQKAVTNTDKSTVMSNVRGRSVITSAKEVVISVKNNAMPTTSYAETEERSSVNVLPVTETAGSKVEKRLIGTAQTIITNVGTANNKLDQIAQVTGGINKDGIVSTSFEFGKSNTMGDFKGINQK